MATADAVDAISPGEASPSKRTAEDSENVHPQQRRKRKKIAVMDESGLTDSDRRQLRASQRDLHTRIAEGTVEGREENNSLFKSVLYTREAVLDSENVSLLATKYVQKVERLVEVPRYDANKLVNKLASKCQNAQSGFDWGVLGVECGICFNSVPSRVNFLVIHSDGDTVIKPRQQKKRQALTQEESEQVKPQEVDNSKTEGNAADKLSASEKTLKVVKATLKEEVKKAYEKDKSTQVNGINFLLNPRSFTQSVENIFQYSFLIKKSDAGIRVKDQRLETTLRRQSDDPPEPTQAVIPLTMRDWRRLIASHDVKEPTIPHRRRR